VSIQSAKKEPVDLAEEIQRIDDLLRELEHGISELELRVSSEGDEALQQVEKLKSRLLSLANGIAQRKHPRIRTGGIVELTPGKGGDALDAQLEDLSEGGLRIHTGSQIASGEEYSVDIDLGDEGRLNAGVEILWTETTPEGTRAGGKFKALQTRNTDTLFDILTNLSVRASQRKTEFDPA